MRKFFVVALGLWLWSCGTDKTANPLTPEHLQDSLYYSLKDSLLESFNQAGYDEMVTDSVYDRLYAQFYDEQMEKIESRYDSITQHTLDSIVGNRDSVMSYRDSMQNAELDSLRGTIYDSLYNEVYWDLYSENAQKNLSAYVYASSKYLMPATYDYQDSLYEDMSVSHLIKININNLASGGVLQSKPSYKVTVKARVPGFTETAVLTKNVSSTTEFALTPALKWDALAKLADILETQIEYEVTVLHNDKEFTLDAGNRSLEVMPINVMPYYYTYTDGTAPKIKDFYTRWVQVVGDSMSALIQGAKAQHPDKKMVGYQNPGKDSALVARKQVEAIYKAIKARNVAYVNSAISGAGQRVRTPSQTLRDKSAVCIDGVILFASAIGAVGLHPVIVAVPGHAFVGWKTWEDSDEMEFLETTMVNTGTFANARTSATTAYNDGVTAGDVQIIDVLAMHKKGLTPFPVILEY